MAPTRLCFVLTAALCSMSLACDEEDDTTDTGADTGGDTDGNMPDPSSEADASSTDPAGDDTAAADDDGLACGGLLDPSLDDGCEMCAIQMCCEIFTACADNADCNECIHIPPLERPESCWALEGIDAVSGCINGPCTPYCTGGSCSGSPCTTDADCSSIGCGYCSAGSCTS